MGGERAKQYLPLTGKPLIEHTLERLAMHPRIAGLLVVLSSSDSLWPGCTCVAGKPLLTTPGGAERSDSVFGRSACACPRRWPDDDFVLVHDAARPCVRQSDISRLIDAVGDGARRPARGAVRDTLKRADADGRSVATEPREQRWRAFTPQMFRRGQLAAALKQAQRREARRQ